LAERADENVAARPRVLLRAASCAAERADAVRVVDHEHDVLAEPVVVATAQLRDLGQWRVVAAHGEDAVRHDDGALSLAGCLLECALEVGNVVVAVHELPGGSRESHRVDDAVVVQLVADENGPLGRQRHDRAEHRRVGGAEAPGGLAPRQLGQAPHERDARLVAYADEAHGAGSGAPGGRGLFLGFDDLGNQRQAQVGVGVHPEELALALSLEPEARAALTRRRNDFDDDRFSTLRGARLLELRNVLRECVVQSIERHTGLRRKSDDYSFREAACVSRRSRSRTIMSSTMRCMSYSCFHPHSSRAAESSSLRGHESAIAWRTGSTSYSISKLGMCFAIALASDAGVSCIA